MFQSVELKVYSNVSFLFLLEIRSKKLVLKNQNTFDGLSIKVMKILLNNLTQFDYVCLYGNI